MGTIKELIENARKEPLKERKTGMVNLGADYHAKLREYCSGLDMPIAKFVRLACDYAMERNNE